MASLMDTGNLCVKGITAGPEPVPAPAKERQAQEKGWQTQQKQCRECVTAGLEPASMTQNRVARRKEERDDQPVMDGGWGREQ